MNEDLFSKAEKLVIAVRLVYRAHRKEIDDLKREAARARVENNQRPAQRRDSYNVSPCFSGSRSPDAAAPAEIGEWMGLCAVASVEILSVVVMGTFSTSNLHSSARIGSKM